MTTPMLRTEALDKAFVLHLQGGLRLPVLRHVDLAVHAGECIALTGPSGAGKTTLLRSLYGNYRADGGKILVRHDGADIDIAAATPREVVRIRAHTLGYVSQFLRVVPRVAALFSGGEQQRINLARGFIGAHPILLLDEPTASLDAENRDIVIAMIREAKATGTAIVGIFHDGFVRDAVADRTHTVAPLSDAA